MKHKLFATAALLVLVVLSSTGYTAALTPTNSPINRPMMHIRNSTSSNWAGYAIADNLKTPTVGSVSNVLGSWTVPNIVCSRSTTYSSMWVGLDGYINGTVEQTGTEQDCNRSRPTYFAWYEMYPNNPYRVSMTVSPGNTITASVAYNGSNSFTLKIADNTTGKSFSIARNLSGTGRQSAEWITEAPSSYFGVLPLSNLGTVNFTGGSATIDGHTGPIGDPAFQNDPLTMMYSSTVAKATPSKLNATNDGFSVTWSHN